MNQQAYMDFVTNTVENTPYGTAIRTLTVAEALATAFQMDMEKARKVTNVYLKRLKDKGVIARVTKGVYARSKTTIMGIAVPGREALAVDMFLNHDGDVIGYETGPAFLNRIGLSTLLPRDRQIATNRYRAVAPKYAGLALQKPLDIVTTENAPYLQMVELLRDVHRFPVDAEKPENLIAAHIDNRKLDREQLARYASAYLKANELPGAIDLIFGRLDNREAA